MKKLMTIVMSALSAPAEFRPGEKIILKGYTVKNAVGQNIKDIASRLDPKGENLVMKKLVVGVCAAVSCCAMAADEEVRIGILSDIHVSRGVLGAGVPRAVPSDLAEAREGLCLHRRSTASAMRQAADAGLVTVAARMI